MKIIEAMKELKIIEKRMEKNIELITKYSAQLSNERLYFDTIENQKKEVLSLIQANFDLSKNYVSLKTKIETTNLSTKVEYAEGFYTIYELLIYQRKMGKANISTLEALTDRLVRMMKFNSEEKVTVERFYDEKKKNEALRTHQDFYEGINSRLEVINATTDLIE